jgi:hypothetical protein
MCRLCTTVVVAPAPTMSRNVARDIAERVAEERKSARRHATRVLPSILIDAADRARFRGPMRSTEPVNAKVERRQ